METVPIVQIAAMVIYWMALVAFYVLWARVVLDLVRQLRRGWKPKGFWLMLSVAILSITDPPLNFMRRFIKPVRIGGAAFDFAILILMVLLMVVMAIASGLA